MRQSSRPKANGASETFAAHSQNGTEANAPNGKARREPGSSKGIVVTNATDSHTKSQRQAQSRNGSDPFGPRSEWSTGVELWPTLEEWLTIMGVLFNGNEDPYEYLMWLDEIADFAKATRSHRTNKRLDRHVVEVAKRAYDTLQGTAGKDELYAIGFYPYNAITRTSFWGAIDIDAHEGLTPEQAFAIAVKIVTYLDANHGDLAVIACTSGESGGWHVFVFRRTPWSIADWTTFLNDVVTAVGGRVEKGVIEIHPPKTDARPRGILVPGCAKRYAPVLIAFDSLTQRLNDWRACLPTIPRLPENHRSLNSVYYLDSSFKGLAPLVKIKGLRARWVKRLAHKYAITSAKMRNSRTLAMTGEAMRYGSRELALIIAGRMYDEAKVRPQTSRPKHLQQVAIMCRNIERTLLKEYSAAEVEVYRRSKTEDVQAAFRLVHSYVRLNGREFELHRNTLAAQVNVSPQRGSEIRRLFCEQGILELIAAHNRKERRATRYRYLLPFKNAPSNGEANAPRPTR